MNKDRINYIYANYDELTWTKAQQEKFLEELKCMNMTSIDAPTKEKIDTLMTKLNQALSASSVVLTPKNKRKKIKNKNIVNDDELEKELIRKTVIDESSMSREKTMSPLVVMSIVMGIVLLVVGGYLVYGIFDLQNVFLSDAASGIGEYGEISCIKEEQVDEGIISIVTTRNLEIDEQLNASRETERRVRLTEDEFASQRDQERYWSESLEEIERMEVRVEFHDDLNEIRIIQEQTGRLGPRDGLSRLNNFRSHFEAEGYTCS